MGHRLHQGFHCAASNPSPAGTVRSAGEKLTHPRRLLIVITITAFLCALFTAGASSGLWLLSILLRVDEEPGFMAKLFAKASLFGVIALATGWILVRTRLPRDREASADPESGNPIPNAKRLWMGLAPALCIAAALTFPHLDRYPAPEPDEAHHLIVSRNLAEYGVYGSGHPTTGFRVLDEYDSVGPAVLLPVAAAFRLGGTGIVTARLIMAGFFLVLCWESCRFFAGILGARAAVAGVFVLLGAVGSVYLGRTLYGEVPALLFLLAGLTLWRLALHRSRPLAPALLAGILFGVAILCKALVLLVAWAFLGAIVYDWMTRRSLRVAHLAAPAAGAAAVVGPWLLVQCLFRQGATAPTLDALGVYRHNLMFGFDSVGATLGWFLDHPLATLASAASMISCIPIVFDKRYDLPAIALFFCVPFLVFWWCFFTTGNLPRYLWYACAIASFFIGHACWDVLRHAWWNRRVPRMAVACVIGFAALSAPTLGEIRLQLDWVYTHDDLRDLRDLAAFVESLPEDATVATLYWPLERSLDFLSGRAVTSFRRPPGPDDVYDVLIVHRTHHSDYLTDQAPDRAFGPYAVLNREG